MPSTSKHALPSATSSDVLLHAVHVTRACCTKTPSHSAMPWCVSTYSLPLLSLSLLSQTRRERKKEDRPAFSQLCLSFLYLSVERRDGEARGERQAGATAWPPLSPHLSGKPWRLSPAFLSCMAQKHLYVCMVVCDIVDRVWAWWDHGQGCWTGGDSETISNMLPFSLFACMACLCHSCFYPCGCSHLRLDRFCFSFYSLPLAPLHLSMSLCIKGREGRTCGHAVYKHVFWHGSKHGMVVCEQPWTWYMTV